MRRMVGVGITLCLIGCAALAVQGCNGDETGSVDGRGPLIPPRTAGPIDSEMAARVAVVYSSCAGEFGADVRLDQMYKRFQVDWMDVRSFAKCIDGRRIGCGAISACMGIDMVSGGSCAPHCNGTTIETCNGAFMFRANCAFIGKTCVMDSEGSPQCVDPGAPACTEPPISSASIRCGTDGRPVACENGRETFGPECARHGLDCVEGDSGTLVNFQCSGAEGDCPGGGYISDYDQIIFAGKSCNGNKLTACVALGMTTLDCGTLITDATCQLRPANGVYEFTCGVGIECRQGDVIQTTCDGDSVVVCNGGRIDRVDCRTLGFTGCVGSSDGAFCSPSPKADWITSHDAY